MAELVDREELERRRDSDAGVVDEPGQRPVAELGAGGGDRGRRRSRRSATVRRPRPREPLRVLVLAHAGHGVEAELAQVERRGLADAGRGAGDEDGSARHASATTTPLARTVELEDAIRTRRTHKAYGPEPVPRETLEELFELARWAPNHNLTNPWRFRVLGPEALARLKEAAGPEAAAKLDRAPTLVVASVLADGDPVQDEEDLCAAAVASYIVLLGAHARGLAGYWRTPAVLRTPEGRAARRGAEDDERVLGLLHLGHAAPGAGAARAAAARRLRNVPPVIPRADALAALERESFDLVVVGGGITGAGVALDAASRGYSVALVEKADFAAGTSSRSSKLIHGGLRYLQNFDLGLVREALLERSLLVKLAPHLVKPLPLLVPALRGQAPRPADRRGPEHVRRDGVAPRAATSEEWSPERHRTSTARRRVEMRARPGRARPERRLPLLRLPDRRRRGWC